MKHDNKSTQYCFANMKTNTTANLPEDHTYITDHHCQSKYEFSFQNDNHSASFRPYLVTEQRPENVL